MKWWMILLLPITLPILLLGIIYVFIVGGCEVVKATFWPDSMG